MARFITFEGIDGSGKTTAMAAAAKALMAQGAHVWTTREETQTPYGDLVRASIQEGAPPLATTYLFLADRAQHIGDIRRHLEDGPVLSDRFLHSTLAYQSVTLDGIVDDPESFLRGLHEPLGLEPDHVVLLDLPADVAVSRVAARGLPTAYEKVAFLEKVRQKYRQLAEAEADRFTVLDATMDQDALAEAAADAVRALL